MCFSPEISKSSLLVYSPVTHSAIFLEITLSFPKQKDFPALWILFLWTSLTQFEMLFLELPRLLDYSYKGSFKWFKLFI